MRRLQALVLALVALAWAVPAAQAADWRSEQPVSSSLGVPAPLGAIGDVEFWAPNRGVLITQGSGGMPAGIYAYDGTGWHLYSTVCGGHDGRIAWTGPTEFWTISDQQIGQEKVPGESQEFQYWNRSLCHFKDGKVVASFGEPLGLESSYSRMSAAACQGPDDCWFAGDRLPGTVNAGAFHLHWNGSSLTATPSLTEPQPQFADPNRAVQDLAFHQGQLYESVQVQADDGEVPGEPDPQTLQPSFLHLVDPGASTPVTQLFPEQPLQFGSGVQATDLAAFRFAEMEGNLWAFAGAAGSNAVTVTALRLDAGRLAQVPLADPGKAFAPADQVLGVAAEPGSGRIWVSFRHAADGGTAPARLVPVYSDGTVGAPVSLPGEGEGIGRKGRAGPVSCPAGGQCWMATERGWLFHLGGQLPRDTDPAMQALITSRPCDSSCPFVPPVDLPIDDSGAEVPVVEIPSVGGGGARTKARAVVVGVKQRLIGERILQLSFTLKLTARVQLVAKRGGRTVAKTPRAKLGKGRHRLRLRLDPERWPTSLDLRVDPLGGGTR